MNLSESYTQHPNAIVITYYCSDGGVVEVCCFSSYLEASIYVAVAPDPCVTLAEP